MDIFYVDLSSFLQQSEQNKLYYIVLNSGANSGTFVKFF